MNLHTAQKIAPRTSQESFDKRAGSPRVIAEMDATLEKWVISTDLNWIFKISIAANRPNSLENLCADLQSAVYSCWKSHPRRQKSHQQKATTGAVWNLAKKSAFSMSRANAGKFKGPYHLHLCFMCENELWPSTCPQHRQTPSFFGFTIVFFYFLYLFFSPLLWERPTWTRGEITGQ